MSLTGSDLHVSEYYKGPRQDGLRHGKDGAMYYSNGDIYKGWWALDRREGEGLQLYARVGDRYEGHWHDDEWGGKGKWTLDDGAYIEGSFKGERTLHGFCYTMTSEGHTVEAMWKDGRIVPTDVRVTWTDDEGETM
jgi:hypothetical protein